MKKRKSVQNLEEEIKLSRADSDKYALEVFIDKVHQGIQELLFMKERLDRKLKDHSEINGPLQEELQPIYEAIDKQIKDLIALKNEKNKTIKQKIMGRLEESKDDRLKELIASRRNNPFNENFYHVFKKLSHKDQTNKPQDQTMIADAFIAQMGVLYPFQARVGYKAIGKQPDDTSQRPIATAIPVSPTVMPQEEGHTPTGWIVEPGAGVEVREDGPLPSDLDLDGSSFDNEELPDYNPERELPSLEELGLFDGLSVGSLESADTMYQDENGNFFDRDGHVIPPLERSENPNLTEENLRDLAGRSSRLGSQNFFIVPPVVDRPTDVSLSPEPLTFTASAHTAPVVPTASETSMVSVEPITHTVPEPVMFNSRDWEEGPHFSKASGLLPRLFTTITRKEFNDVFKTMQKLTEEASKPSIPKKSKNSKKPANLSAEQLKKDQVRKRQMAFYKRFEVKALDQEPAVKKVIGNPLSDGPKGFVVQERADSGNGVHSKPSPFVTVTRHKKKKGNPETYDGFSVPATSMAPDEVQYKLMIDTALLSKRKRLVVEHCEHNPAFALKVYVGLLLYGKKSEIFSEFS